MIYVAYLWKVFFKKSFFMIFLFLFLISLLFSLRSLPLFLYGLDVQDFFPFFLGLNLTKILSIMAPLGFFVAVLFFLLNLKDKKLFLSLGILGFGRKFWFFFWLLPSGFFTLLLLIITLNAGPFFYRKTQEGLKKMPSFFSYFHEKKTLPSCIFPGIFFRFSKGKENFVFYRHKDFLSGEERFFVFRPQDIVSFKDIDFLQQKDKYFCFFHQGSLGFFDPNNNLKKSSDPLLKSTLFFQRYGFLVSYISFPLTSVLSSSLQPLQGLSSPSLWRSYSPLSLSPLSSSPDNLKAYREWSYRFLLSFSCCLLFFLSYILSCGGLFFSSFYLSLGWFLSFLFFLFSFLLLLLHPLGFFVFLGSLFLAGVFSFLKIP